MLIEPVDQECNLFRVTDVFPQHMVDLVMTESWLTLPWQRQPGQETWLRRRIDNTAIGWADQWDRHLQMLWPQVAASLNIKIADYQGTAWWLDEPGFQCAMHTDGEMPGSLHLIWSGPGTSFYWYKNTDSLRYRVPAEANSGYIMLNLPDATGYRKLQWHAMLDPVPQGTFRLTSYSWIIPV